MFLFRILTPPTLIIGFFLSRQLRRYEEIPVSRQFFEISGRHGDFFRKKKQKNSFLDKVNRSMCVKFQVCIVVSVARKHDTNTYINTYIYTYTSEFKNILGGCSPHVDFEKSQIMYKFIYNKKLGMLLKIGNV